MVRPSPTPGTAWMPGVLPRSKGLEDAVEVLGANADAAVADLELGALAGRIADAGRRGQRRACT